MNKIDFTVFFEVIRANPNGDPDNDNLPRTDSQELGLVTNVALKRKMRNYMHLVKGPIYLANKDNDMTLYPEETFEALVSEYNELSKYTKKTEAHLYEKELKEYFCNKFIDVRFFGQVITTKASKGSIALKNSSITGAVEVTNAVSVDPIYIEEHAITKSVSTKRENAVGSSDTMGGRLKFVSYGLYRFDGAIRGRMAEKNKITEEDIEIFKQTLVHLFSNDGSSARPAGSMNVVGAYLWEHSTKDGDLDSYEVQNSVKIHSFADGTPKGLEDYKIEIKELPVDSIKFTKLKERFERI